MGVRFSDIQRADALKAQKEKYDKWNQANLGERSKLYRQTLATRSSKISRVARRVGYIMPFNAGVPSTAKLLIQTRVPDKDNAPDTSPVEAVGSIPAITLESAQSVANQLYSKPEFSDRILLNAPSAGTRVLKAPRGKSERPALIKLVLRGAKKMVESRITGRPYNSYPDAKTVSSPVGQKIKATAIESEQAAFAALQVPWATDDAYKVILTPQTLDVLVTP